MAEYCAGNERAFEALFNRHAEQVKRLAQRLVLDSSQANDVLQMTFMSVVRSRERYIQGSPFRPWLFAIAMNAARDAWRRRKTEAIATNEVPEVMVEPNASDPGLETRVRAALDKLPHGQREAIVLHRFEGLSYAEIAEAAGLSESAIKVRAHRGSRVLRELLRGEWEE